MKPLKVVLITVLTISVIIGILAGGMLVRDCRESDAPSISGSQWYHYIVTDEQGMVVSYSSTQPPLVRLIPKTTTRGAPPEGMRWAIPGCCLP